MHHQINSGCRGQSGDHRKNPGNAFLFRKMTKTRLCPVQKHRSYDRTERIIQFAKSSGAKVPRPVLSIPAGVVGRTRRKVGFTTTFVISVPMSTARKRKTHFPRPLKKAHHKTHNGHKRNIFVDPIAVKTLTISVRKSLCMLQKMENSHIQTMKDHIHRSPIEPASKKLINISGPSVSLQQIMSAYCIKNPCI